MFSRDYLLRQLQQFVHAVALVLTKKRQGQEQESQVIIHNTMMDVLGVSLEDARTLDKEALLKLLSPGGELRHDFAVAAADLLAEDNTFEGRLRAAWIYETVLVDGGPVPFDVYDRIQELSAPYEAP